MAHGKVKIIRKAVTFSKKHLSRRQVDVLRHIKWQFIGLFWRLRGRKIVHVFHVGKTGGTALIKALKYNTTTPAYRIIFHLHSWTLKDTPCGHKVIFFIRHPIKKFVSAFYCRLRESCPSHNSPWRAAEKAAFEVFKTPNELALGLSSKDPAIRESAVHAMKNIEHLSSFYRDWFISEGYFLSRFKDILFIGLTERMESDFTILKGILRIKNDCRLSKNPIDANSSRIASKDKHLDETARSNLVAWYEEDIRFYDFLIKQRDKISNIHSGYEF